uniref:Uncharacterized protein n=1 Tax=Electrophorus electricus TaxID=8005 RepID=A0A4W4GRS2_ELEEL
REKASDLSVITSPQKQTVKNRSRSTDEVQQAKKAFHTPQKSLPAKPETEKLEVKPNFTTHQPLVSHHLKDQPHSHIATRQHTRSVLSPQSVCHLTPRRWFIPSLAPVMSVCHETFSLLFR